MLDVEYRKLSADERIDLEQLQFSKETNDKLQGRQKVRARPKKDKEVESVLFFFWIMVKPL